MKIKKDIKNHLEESFIRGSYSKTLLHKLIVIKSLEICNLAESKGSFELSLNKYRLETLLENFN